MPLDGNAPAVRNALILAQATLCMLLVAQPLESPHGPTIPQALVSNWRSLLTEIPNLLVSVVPDALGYDVVVIFASGATRRLKGV